MIRLSSLLDWWGRSYHTSRRNVVEAALQKAGERGRTKQELVVDTEFAQHQVRRALRTLQKEARVEMTGDRYRVRGPKGK
jgi:hypothetical protein